MSNGTFFCHLDSARIAELVKNANGPICYAGPGIQIEPAKAFALAAKRIGPELITVSLDFDERVMRMGYGSVEAVKLLRDAGIVVNHAPGLRSALLIVDGEGFVFTPNALYLEAENSNENARNTMRLSKEQVYEAMARLSPSAKAIAIANTKNLEEKERVENLPIEIGSVTIKQDRFIALEKNLAEAPPVAFDLARQVRVFEPYLQYVELNLSGAAIQRHRLAIPQSIQKLGGGKDIEHRLRTTFDLIEKGGKLSSKPLEDKLNEIRKNFTPSLGKDHGRVVLKSAKPHLHNRLGEFRKELETHKKQVEDDLQKHLDESRKQIIEYYLPRVIESPPDALLGQLLRDKPSEEVATRWIAAELDRVFPKAKSLIDEMKLEERFKDVTFETLNRDDFLTSVKQAFPHVDWDKAYNEFRAAGEAGKGN